MKKIKAIIIGASGYVGGEALRLLLSHPFVEVVQATSETYNGKFVHVLHPNLRKKTMLKFTSLEKLEHADVIFLALPHKVSSSKIDYIMSKAKKVIDKGSDFRLKNKEDYEKWYDFIHPKPELLNKFVYGIPELHREEIKKADYVAAAGCNATAVILGMSPLFKEGLVKSAIADVKAGSSQSGAKPSRASHYSERRDCLRSFKPTGHRHLAEIYQECRTNKDILNMSVTSIGNVRGILATIHVELNKELDEKEVWRIYRKYYRKEPFIRIVKESRGIYRYPEPKILAGTNYCDIGFELDKTRKNRLVVMSAIDNLMKGSAGQAVQCMNLMFGFDETAGLEFAGLHPI